MMRIVIDMQGAQSTGSRNRGIGRYTLAIAQAIVRNRGEHEVIIALSGMFPETIQSIRADFYNLLPKENIRVWHATGPVSYNNANNKWRRQSAEFVREAFLSSLNPSIILIASLFEGLEDDAVTSIGALSKTIPTAAVLYDLIPLINQSHYLDNPTVASWYNTKLSHLRCADLLLSISESSRQESIDHLDTPADHVVNISTATEPKFRKQVIGSAHEAAIRQRYGLKKSYVMYTGGIDHRKNIERLIRAYASLPADIRQSHQLAIVCSIQPPDRARLEKLAKGYGLARNELILTGYVSEEDLIVLYNVCKVFIFPSWHEGFGLPALEAMACGCPVIGSNTSSVPEVIGCAEALFDPHNDVAIANKLQQVLTNDDFRIKLQQHGLKQAKKFSWDKCAQNAISAMEKFVTKGCVCDTQSEKLPSRPRLAYVSPLPPERSGISDYSAELLPTLACHYDIEVVVAQDKITTPWINDHCPIRTVEWFQEHADQFDRVLYHFGNSPFHQHMFTLLEAVPGVVVLHDFFLSGVIGYMNSQGIAPGIWSESLYIGHGYEALYRSCTTKNTDDIVWEYPCNLAVLKNAQGVIIHSEESRRLAKQWYGEKAGMDWAHIPLLRTLQGSTNNTKREEAREALGLRNDNFVVCSFGRLGPTKLNRRLLDAWLASPLAKDERCVLVFVGENDAGEYGRNILKFISNSGLGARIKITGWADADAFQKYLIAADVGVQLRTWSRGETSAAVLDCMIHGLPTIVNAHGSMIDLPDKGVWKLPDEFSDAQLAEALVVLFRDETLRVQLGKNAREIVCTQHDPRICAEQYSKAIESFYHTSRTSVLTLINHIAQIDSSLIEADGLLTLAEAIDRSIDQPFTQQQIFIDISVLIQHDAKTGIQRVVRSVLWEWLLKPPVGYRIEPVYATETQFGYRYARQFTLGFLGCPSAALSDEPISYRAGDIFLGLDFHPEIVAAQRAFYQALRREGAYVNFVAYDLLNISMPQYFPSGSVDGFKRWLEVVAEGDAVLCISKAVADDFANWLRANTVTPEHPLQVNWFHLGADVDNTVSTKGLPTDANSMLSCLRNGKSFLMVSTLEPRKGHAQVLAAFENLWTQGEKVNLVFVGKQGWNVEQLVVKLRSHPEFHKRLFWLEGISDEYLEKIYAASTCLIAASYGEGFGLPLIEAAQHKLPIVARDIPVFREVAGEHAFYFNSSDSQGLTKELHTWLELYKAGNHVKSDELPWLTWEQSAENLKEAILGRNPNKVYSEDA